MSRQTMALSATEMTPPRRMPAWSSRFGATAPEVALYALLAALVLSLALVHLIIGPWFHVYNPSQNQLLEGWPVEWEAAYYVVHFPSFLGDVPPGQGIAPVHYRSFIALYLASILYAWSGSAFWSIAAVELAFWWGAGVAVYHAGTRLGLRRAPAALASIFTVAGPLFVSNMWMHVFHLAEFATMAIGLWAALVLLEEQRSARRLALAWGIQLLLLSLSYTYQWLIAPLLFVLAATDPRYGPRRAFVLVAGALVLYFAGTAVLKAILAAAVPAPAGILAAAVSDPSELARARLDQVRSGAGLLVLLPGRVHLVRMVESFHPLVIIAATVGLAFLPRRVALLGLVATFTTLCASTLYQAPWTSMSAYPFVYLAAGAGVVHAGTAVARACLIAGNRNPNGSRFASLASLTGRTVTASLATLLIAITNLDLIGDTRFLLQWWHQFARAPLF